MPLHGRYIAVTRVARFLNHCCEPNLFVQSVFIDYSCRVHRIALFAARDILPYEELTYDYGYVVRRRPPRALRARDLKRAWRPGRRCVRAHASSAHRCARAPTRQVGSVEGKTLKCLCGAPSCRGYLF